MNSEFTDKLKKYYENLFPYQLIHNWLNYHDGGPNIFKYREFSFTLQGDIYIRYQAFGDGFDLRNALSQRVPIKIDVGAVYNINPKFCKTYPGTVEPLQHELVFDIDISDYDDVRNCCKESNICSKCWPLMKIGAKILHAILTKEFGFKHLLFVYSGRRGFHCWVCDKVARKLPNEARKAIADYFAVVVGGQAMVKRVTLNHLNGLHPMINKSLQIIDQHFEEVMIDNQDFLSSEHLAQNVVDMCEDRSLKPLLSLACRNNHYSTKHCWEAMIKETTRFTRTKSNKSKYFIEEVKLQLCFPRLDANVTRGMNHLLKLPFCIHPKTGNVCVPIDIDDIDSFDIESVPNMKDLSSSSLDSYVKIMKKFVDHLAADTK